MFVYAGGWFLSLFCSCKSGFELLQSLLMLRVGHAKRPFGRVAFCYGAAFRESTGHRHVINTNQHIEKYNFSWEQGDPGHPVAAPEISIFCKTTYLTKWLTIRAQKCRAVVMTQRLDQVFAALADPTRREILNMLLEDDMAVTDVAEPFEMSLAAISKHLTVLTLAGLISQEKRGRVKWCKLEPDALRGASVWMQGFGQFEPVNLDAFERFLEKELPATSVEEP